MIFPKKVLAGLGGAVLLSALSAIPTSIIPDSVARAGIFQGYNPPENFSRIERTQGAGSRGCSEGQPISLNLITPNDHVATTVSGHPTFMWHVSAPAPMSFALVEPGVAKPVLEKQLKVEKAGIVQLDLPQEIPQFVEGKEYRWTVSIVCDENNPSENIYARSWVKRVSITPSLKQKLAVATQERERAAVYAQNGVWYDASATIYKASQKAPRDHSTSEYLTKLLQQVGLSNIAIQEQRRFTLGLQPKEK